MSQQHFRTYHRRATTRESGYHTCDEATGAECRVVRADRYCPETTEPVIFTFRRQSVELHEVFESGEAMVAFGGYVRSRFKAVISMSLGYVGEAGVCDARGLIRRIEGEVWTPVGMHVRVPLERTGNHVELTAQMSLSCPLPGNDYDFVSFDLDAVSTPHFRDATLAESFAQKTSFHIPHIYYLRSDLPFDTWLTSGQELEAGPLMALKSCNRCGRYLPINVENEVKTLAYSLHCVKDAPCAHPSFRSYKVMNLADLSPEDKAELSLEGDRLTTRHGHQLECRACKKFFVNAPLNPIRTRQQRQEDGLRRRALEILVNSLLGKNLVHFEFEKDTSREFSEHIWEKFNRRCFKCGPDSEPLDLEEMDLDHTMPLAYLYRLDETATCLCEHHNSQKRDHFPVEFYSDAELERLARITGLSLETLHSREVNPRVLQLLVENVVWFYDTFLMDPEYQKVRDGIKTADKINDALKKVIAGRVDLAEEYRARKGRYPYSVTIG